MDAVKRASFASRQMPCGPAPLASFEDLPSDELDSPEDLGGLKDGHQPHREGSQDDTSDVNTVISVNTPDTLNFSNVSTPQIDQIESDFDSHCTLTPVDTKAHTGSEFRTGSLSSLPKEDDQQLTKQKKGSVVSLGNYETAEVDLNQRKGSWADIFRNHNQNPKASVVENTVNVDTKVKPVHKKKSKSESRRERGDVKSKDKNKIFGIFKANRKGSKTIEATSEDSLRIGNITKPLPVVDNVVIGKEIGDVNGGKENEQPKSTEIVKPNQLKPTEECQNDLGKLSMVNTDENKLLSNKENDMRNNLNISEKEFNIFSGKTDESPCENVICNEHNETKPSDGHESSESELAFDSKEEPVSKKEDDFEKENLLAQDSSEMEDDSSIELQPSPVFIIPQSVPIITRQQRLEVTTVPIDRPRSTTPINVAPLEAFIHSTSSSSFDLKVDKIKLTLPGEQFLGRMKSPKRSTAKSWADFCEEGLHSPRMQKKNDDFHLSEDALDSRLAAFDNTTAYEKDWVVFEPQNEREDTPDLFRDLPIEETSHRNACETSSSKNETSQISKCSCECHSHGCENSYIKIDEHFASFSGSTKADVFSDKCQCQCHEKFVHLWSPTDTTNSSNLLSDICDTLKSSEFSSDFASFASDQF